MKFETHISFIAIVGLMLYVSIALESEIMGFFAIIILVCYMRRSEKEIIQSLIGPIIVLNMSIIIYLAGGTSTYKILKVLEHGLYIVTSIITLGSVCLYLFQHRIASIANRWKNRYDSISKLYWAICLIYSIIGIMVGNIHVIIITGFFSMLHGITLLLIYFDICMKPTKQSVPSSEAKPLRLNVVTNGVSRYIH